MYYYYHGNTADLEIGQEVEDAELEEEGAKEVLKATVDWRAWRKTIFFRKHTVDAKDSEQQPGYWIDDWLVEYILSQAQKAVKAFQDITSETHE